jgi:integrase
MPARQRGSVARRGSTWSARFYDAENFRRSRGGFPTKTAARDWLERQLDEVEALRSGERVAPEAIPTVNELVDGYLATHEVDPATTNKLRSQLRHATRAFDGRKIDELAPLELSTWRTTLPERTRHQLFGAFKAVLEHAVTLDLLQTNPAGRIKNRQARLDESREIRPFTDWGQVEMVAAELIPLYAPIPIVLVGSGLRPEELCGLEWRDVDLKEGVLNIERVYTKGLLKSCRKSDRQPARCRYARASSRSSRRSRAASVRHPCFSPGAAEGSNWRRSVTATGTRRSQRSRMRVSSTAASTPAGTRSRPGASAPASTCSTSHG